MKLKKSIACLLAVVMMLCLFAGCSDDAPAGNSDTSTPTAGSNTEAPSADTLFGKIVPGEEYVIISCLNNIEYFNAQKYGCDIYSKLFGVKVSFMGPADDNINDMVAAFETAIAKEPAGICVWGYDEAVEPSIEKAQSLGIPVITYINDIGDSRSTYVGTSAFELGYTGAREYAEMIGGKGQVAILTLTGNDSFMERCEGFEAGFAEYPGIEVVAVGDTKADSTTAINVAKDIAVKYEDLNGFVCCDSTGASGAATALSELGLTGKVDVLGLDRNKDVLNMVKDGTITATLAQDDVAMVYWSLVTLISAAHVDFPLTSDNAAAGATVLPSYIYTPVNMVTKDNVDYYLETSDLYATNSY